MKNHFRKILFALSLPLLLCSFLIPSNSYALGSLDQYCSNWVANSQTTAYTGNSETYQVFVPTKDTLDSVSVWLQTVVGTSSQVKVDVINATSSNSYTIASMTKQISTQGAWITYDFPDVAMPYGIYVIHVKSMDMPNQAIWKMAPQDCYSRGFAIINGSTANNMDFGFGVYDYGNSTVPGGNSNPPANNPPAGNPPSGSNPAPAPAGSTPVPNPLGISSGSGQTPATVTSPSILPPTNLAAKDTLMDSGGSIDLNWTASTSTNIDGYKIFRRAEGDNQYVEILRLPKTFTKFKDVWATKDKTYYYKIRSFKSSQESADSNVASATSKDDWTTQKNAILDDYKKSSGNTGVLGEAGFMLIIPIVIILLIIGLFILGLWVLLHKKKQPPISPPPTPKEK